MTTLTFNNNDYYPTLKANLGTDLTDLTVEIEILKDEVLFHNDYAVIRDRETGVVAYDLDGVPQFAEREYQAEFKLYDQSGNLVNTLPADPFTLDVRGPEATRERGEVLEENEPEISLDSIPHDFVVEFVRENGSENQVSRPFMWDRGEVTIYCSPDGGEDAAGTVEDPLTLHAALKSMPFFYNDEVVVDLYTVPASNEALPATYNNGFNTFRPPIMNGMTTLADVTLLGNPDNPADVVVENGLNWGAYGKGDCLVDGIEFHASVQMNGFATIRDCNIYQRGNYGTQGVCLGIKKGILKVKSCTIGEGNLGRLVNVTDAATIGFSGTNLISDGSAEPLDGSPGTQFYGESGTKVQLGPDANLKGVGNMDDDELVACIRGTGVSLYDNNGRHAMTQGSRKEVYKSAVTFS